MSPRSLTQSDMERVALQVHVPRHLYNEVVQAANSQDRTVSNFVRHLLRQHMATQAGTAA